MYGQLVKLKTLAIMSDANNSHKCAKLEKRLEKGQKGKKKMYFSNTFFCRSYFIGFQDSLALSNIFEKSSFDHFAVNKYTFRKKTADVY